MLERELHISFLRFTFVRRSVVSSHPSQKESIFISMYLYGTSQLLYVMYYVFFFTPVYDVICKDVN